MNEYLKIYLSIVSIKRYVIIWGNSTYNGFAGKRRWSVSLSEVYRDCAKFDDVRNPIYKVSGVNEDRNCKRRQIRHRVSHKSQNSTRETQYRLRFTRKIPRIISRSPDERAVFSSLPPHKALPPSGVKGGVLCHFFAEKFRSRNAQLMHSRNGFTLVDRVLIRAN